MVDNKMVDREQIIIVPTVAMVTMATYSEVT